MELKQTKITELNKLPKEIQDYIKLCVKNGFNKNVIRNKDWFMKVSHCIYTAQILSLSSCFTINVVEGFTIDENNKKYLHCWNEYKGYHFNLINDNHIRLKHYGIIINKQELKNHLISNCSDKDTTFTTINNIKQQLYK